MRKHTRQLFSGLAASALACAAIVPACSGSDVSSDLNAAGSPGASGHGGASGLGRAGGAGSVGTSAGASGLSFGGANTDAGADGLSDCNGIAPQCRGTNLQACCGNDPYGPATCASGKWLCSIGHSPPVPAPGCNSHICGQSLGDAGAGGQGGATGADPAACTGQAPNCFGGDLQTCCGRDPAGQATCQNGKWLCFGVAAPGCNGQQCI